MRSSSEFIAVGKELQIEGLMEPTSDSLPEDSVNKLPRQMQDTEGIAFLDMSSGETTETEKLKKGSGISKINRSVT